MLRLLNPQAIAPPFARYSHGIEVPPGHRLIVCSGQLGIGADRTVPESVEDQAALCFANIAAILAEGGMTLSDIVRVNAYVSGREHLARYMATRDRVFAELPPPASTLMIVSGFAREDFKVEIEAIAAAPADNRATESAPMSFDPARRHWGDYRTTEYTAIDAGGDDRRPACCRDRAARPASAGLDRQHDHDRHDRDRHRPLGRTISTSVSCPCNPLASPTSTSARRAR